ncbi:MAG: hypothetical protein ACOC7T_04950 [Planctomycetota bacterium]
MTEEPDQRRGVGLLPARLAWGVVAASGIVLSLVATILPLMENSSPLDWNGLMGVHLPVGRSVLMVAGGIVTPVVVLILRAVTGGLAPPSSRDETSPRPSREWLRSALFFLACVDAIPTAAFVAALIFGTVPLLWLVTGEVFVMLMFYMPRTADFDRRAGSVES